MKDLSHFNAATAATTTHADADMLGQFFFDSAFANGAYSHSFGLESYISWGAVDGAQSFCDWLRAYMLHTFASCDGAIYCIARALANKPLSLLRLARTATASIASAENRAAAISMARATLKNTAFMHNEAAAAYLAACERCEDFAHPAVAFALLSEQDLGAEFAYASIKTLTINATRAIPLSYKKSSELLYTSRALAAEAAERAAAIAAPIIAAGYFSHNMPQLFSAADDGAADASALFSANFELDMAMFAHEKLDFRLFMS